ncbi:DUF723 domain-containing protein [Ferrovum sp.]|uniref:DUF723 domain-containing protein n=1 Tax=Ferrovum sp. TaxID=2609467 RepID=UPI00262B4C4E|nr:DUF723 domain-containing protein [Ferrovum sp.]
MTTVEKNKALFIENGNRIHGGKYDYSKVVYKNVKTPVTIICPTHGEFQKEPHSHTSSKIGCPKCSGREVSDIKSFIEKANTIHGCVYDYSKAVYKNNKTKLTIICHTHGEFQQFPNIHLQGAGCKKCADEGTGIKNRHTLESFAEKAREVHGERYDYSQVNYVGMREAKVTITCSIHGEFQQHPHNHISGQGCPKCGDIKAAHTRSTLREDFLEKVKRIHKNKYRYPSLPDKISNKDSILVTCPTHGTYIQRAGAQVMGYGCPKCVHKVSKPEIELFEFVSSICPDAYQSDRAIIKPKELDIVIPSKSLAIEYNGIYYHSDRIEGRQDNAHKIKTDLCAERGVRLIHLWEDDWLNKTEVVKKTLRHIFGATSIKIGARKCEVKRVQALSVTDFLEVNHLQGAVKRGIAYTLESEGITVAVMVFSSVVSVRGSISSEEDYELVRYATIGNITGGPAKLFAAFLKDTPKCKTIISYSDNDWFDGKMYEQLGFMLDSHIKPDYKVVDGGIRKHKSGYRLNALRTKFGELFDPRLSERENCRNLGLFRVYNSGMKKWRYQK